MKKAAFIGLAQAIGLIVYISFVVLFMNNAETFFGKSSNFFNIIAFLLLFVFSATMCAVIVFGYSTYLFFEGKRKIALNVFGYTIFWIFLILLLVLGITFFRNL